MRNRGCLISRNTWSKTAVRDRSGVEDGNYRGWYRHAMPCLVIPDAHGAIRNPGPTVFAGFRHSPE
jgi:hypothetical protein